MKQINMNLTLDYLTERLRSQHTDSARLCLVEGVEEKKLCKFCEHYEKTYKTMKKLVLQRNARLKHESFTRIINSLIRITPPHGVEYVTKRNLYSTVMLKPKFIALEKEKLKLVFDELREKTNKKL